MVSSSISGEVPYSKLVVYPYSFQSVGAAISSHPLPSFLC